MAEDALNAIDKTMQASTLALAAGTALVAGTSKALEKKSKKKKKKKNNANTKVHPSSMTDNEMEGNKSLTYLLAYNGKNDNDDVLNYLVSKGSGDANDISKGRLDKKYGAPPLLNACKKGTLSLDEAKVLIDGCGQE